MKVNAIIIYDRSAENILMCFRSKDPYKGLYNLVGGKVEAGEDGLAAAYRELAEETGITRDDTVLTHLMDFIFHLDETELQVYVGKLNEDVELREEAHKLVWISADENFFDMTKYAGEGNIGHMLEIVKYHREKLF